MNEQRASSKPQVEERNLRYGKRDRQRKKTRNIVRICRNATREIKADLELRLAKDINENKKVF